MKITFEGKTFHDIADEMESLLQFVTKNIAAAVSTQMDTPTIGETPEKPETSPTVTKPRTAKQLENDERLRAAAKAKLAAKKVAKAPLPPEVREAPPPASAESLGLAPDEMVKVRQKTIEDLQSAYANGFQKEVFELLSRFGNGAKSFRELPPESFVPIREAIDNGALT